MSDWVPGDCLRMYPANALRQWDDTIWGWCPQGQGQTVGKELEDGYRDLIFSATLVFVSLLLFDYKEWDPVRLSPIREMQRATSC